MSNTKPTPPLIASSLVVGGCGFLGYHLVRGLLEDQECRYVHVLDRDTTRNTHEKATYFKGDINDSDLLRQVIDQVRPSVIFHCASPMATLPASRDGELYTTNVKGTELLLKLATESDVRAFVLTSSVDVYANPPFTDADETYPLWSPLDKSNEYNRTKAIGDVLVREANGPQLRTVVLRPGHAYGERHIQGMVEVLDMCDGDKQLFQVGDGNNLMEVVSGENNAIAHILAAKALLDPSRARGKVDGEAFNVSDGDPVPFWHHIGVIWKASRGEDTLKDVIVLPAWLMVVVVELAEWLFWIFSLNTVKPPVQLRRVSMEYCIYTHTHSIEKARKRLLFNPASDHDDVVAKSAKWMLKYRESLKQKAE
ncbi:hypothetical protein FAVG1_02962 [Fusarium avenaceum]|nr:hypothetical protein FAVG1_02962 [Fusarium avenaceum]